MLWEIVDSPHRLLGSAHALPEGTVFPKWVTESHEGIERFIFESGGPGSRKGIGDDRTLAHLKLSGVSEAYQSAKTLLESIGNYDSFDHFLPWKVAFYVVDRFLPILDLSRISGVDFQLSELAKSNRLATDFLESSTRSWELIDSSCKKTDGGLRFLEETIGDIKSGKSNLLARRLTRTWLISDLVDFHAILDETLTMCPSVFYPTIIQRNQEWGLVAKRLCADKSPTLFIVGALHTVGPDSFVEQMRANGLRLNFIA